MLLVSMNFNIFVTKEKMVNKLFLHSARYFRSPAGLKETRTVLSGDTFKLCQAPEAVKIGAHGHFNCF